MLIVGSWQNLNRNLLQPDVTLSIPDMTASADPNGLAMALRNVLDNTPNFTRQAEKPIIEIGGDQTETSCILWVRDNGIGINMKYHDRIFKYFSGCTASKIILTQVSGWQSSQKLCNV